MIRRTFMLLLFLMLILTGARSQKQIDVTNDNLTTDQGIQTAYLVEIPDADLETVIKGWMKAIRQNTKSKPEQSGSKINITGTQINEIHTAPINIYSMVYAVDSIIRVVAAYEIDSMFFSPPEADALHTELQTHGAIKSFMRTFAVDQYRESVQGQLNDEETKLKELNKQFKDLVKQNESMLESVSENEQNIQNSQDAIATLENDNSRLIADITAKRDALAGLSGDEALRDEAKDQLKSLEKEKKGVESKLDKEKKNIVKYESEIKELNRELEINSQQQEEIQAQITDQEGVVKGIAEMLGKIK
jgi:DNA repair exonuclease SbcCD ATPase subunit